VNPQQSGVEKGWFMATAINPRQVQRLLAQGLSLREIARRLEIPWKRWTAHGGQIISGRTRDVRNAGGRPTAFATATVYRIANLYARGEPMRYDDDTELRRHTVTPRGRTPPARGRQGIFVLVALLLVPAVVRAQPMRWPEAVAALAAERTRAETCVQLLKRHAGTNAAALSRGELAYAEAKAEMDAVIAGLTVVLAQRGTPPDLADVEARLTRGVQAR
jgi:hypothetical protein